MEPQQPIDWPAVLLGAAGTTGFVVAALAGGWLWAAGVMALSVLAEVLVVLVRRRTRRAAG